MSRRIPPAEGTEAPWWVIIDPRQMMRADADKVADMVTGPFLSRDEAQEQLDARRYAYSERAVVYCMSGHRSSGWKAFSAEEVPE